METYCSYLHKNFDEMDEWELIPAAVSLMQTNDLQDIQPALPGYT